MGVNVEALLHSCQVGEQTCAHYDSSESNSGLWLGATLGELARHGRDKLTFVVVAADRELRAVGRAADRRVDRQAGPRHAAGRRRAARRSRGVRRRPRVRLSAQRRGPGLRARRGGRRARRRRPADDHAGDPRRGRPRAGSSSWPSSRSRWPAGRWRSTRSISPTCRRPRTPPSGCCGSVRCPRSAVGRRRALRALLVDAGPPHYVAIMGYLPFSDELDAAIVELRARDPRQAPAPRSPTATARASCTRPGSCTRAGPPTGRFLQLVDEPHSRRRAFPASDYSFATLIAAQAAGDLQTLRGHGLPAERVVPAGRHRGRGARAGAADHGAAAGSVRTGSRR